MIRLNPVQNDQLVTFLWDNLEEIQRRELSIDDVAKWATQNLGFEVSFNMVHRRMGRGEDAAISFDWPGRNVSGPGRKRNSEVIGECVLMLEKLRNELGAEATDRWDEIVALYREGVEAA